MSDKCRTAGALGLLAHMPAPVFPFWYRPGNHLNSSSLQFRPLQSSCCPLLRSMRFSRHGEPRHVFGAAMRRIVTDDVLDRCDKSTVISRRCPYSPAPGNRPDRRISSCCSLSGRAPTAWLILSSSDYRPQIRPQ